MKFKRVIAEILAVVLCINTLSISTLAENEAQTFIEVMEQEHIEPIVDQWGQNDSQAENSPEGVLSDADPAEVATGSVVNQWGEEAEILQPEEIVAAEAIEGEVAEAGAETAQTVLAGEGETNYEASVTVGGTTTYYGTLADAINAALNSGYDTTDLIKLQLLKNVDTGKINLYKVDSNNQFIPASDKKMKIEIDFNGFLITGIQGISYVFDLQTGTIYFKDSKAGQTGGIKAVGGDNVMNIGSGGPTVWIYSGTYTADSNVINAFGGKLYVELEPQELGSISDGDSGEVPDPTADSTNMPQFVTLNKGVLVKKTSTAVSIKTGVFKGNRLAEGLLADGYLDYYVQNGKYYVVMLDRPIWVRGATRAEDQGFKNMGAFVKYLNGLGSGSTVLAYLMKDYDCIEMGGVSGGEVPKNIDLTFDLYGHKLTSMSAITIDVGASLLITDTLSGGFIQIPNTIVGKDYIQIEGGTYDTQHPELLEKMLVPGKGLKLIANVYDGHTYYTVVNDTDKILVVGKGGADEFTKALELADDGDTLLLLKSFSGKAQISIKDRTLTLDLNGNTITTDDQALLYIENSDVTVKDSSTGTTKGSLIEYMSGSQTVYLQGKATCRISDINITNMGVSGKAIVTDNGSNSYLTLTDVTISASGVGSMAIEACGRGTEVILEGKTSISRADKDFIKSCIKTGTESSIIINDGTYVNLLMLDCQGNVTVSGGAFSDHLILLDTIPIERAANFHLIDILGGKFSNVNTFAEISEAQQQYLWIYGGDFNSDQTVLPPKEKYPDAVVPTIPLGYLAPGCYQVESNEPGYVFAVSVAAAISGHSVVFGNGLDLKVGIQKNPKLAQYVADNEIMIKVTWTATDDKGQVAESSTYYLVSSKLPKEEHNTYPTEPVSFTVENKGTEEKPKLTYYIRSPFSPQNMSDEVIVEAYAVNNSQLQVPRQGVWGVQIPNQVDTTVREYTQKRYTAASTKTVQTDAMATMLLYGADAQKYRGYKTNDLASDVEWLIEHQETRQYTETPASEKESSFESNGVMFTGQQMVLGSKYLINMPVDTSTFDEGSYEYRMIVQRAGFTDDDHTDIYPVTKGMTFVTIPPQIAGSTDVQGILYMNCPINYKATMQYREKGSAEDWKPVPYVKDGAQSGVETGTTSVNRCFRQYYDKYCNDKDNEKLFNLVNSSYRFGIYARKYAEANQSNK